jgi:hypothetical protein
MCFHKLGRHPLMESLGMDICPRFQRLPSTASSIRLEIHNSILHSTLGLSRILTVILTSYPR